MVLKETEQTANSTVAIFDTQWVGQTFTASESYDLYYIRIQMIGGGTPGEITLNLYNTSGSLPDGAPIATSKVDSNNWSPSAFWRTWYFPEGISLTNGVEYAFTVEVSGSVTCSIRRDTGAGYLDGQSVASFDSGDTWVAQDTRDVTFETHGLSGFIEGYTLSLPTNLNINNTLGRGQSFVLNNDIHCTGVKLFLGRANAGTPTLDLDISIRETTGTPANKLPSGSDLANLTGSIAVSSISGTTDAWYDIDFTGADLKAGKEYCIIMFCQGSASGEYPYLKGSNGNAFTRGNLMSHVGADDTGWVVAVNWDCMFQVIGDENAPEYTDFFFENEFIPDGSNDLYGVNWEAQTFFANDTYDAASAKIRANRTGSPGTVTVALYATSSSLPTGAALASGTFDGDAITDNSEAGETVDIEFSGTASLTQGTEYALVISAASGDASNKITMWLEDAGNIFGGQRAFSANSGSSWTADGTDDYAFAILGVAGTPVTMSGTITGAGVLSGDLEVTTIVTMSGTVVGVGDLSGDILVITPVLISGVIEGVGELSASLGFQNVTLTQQTANIKRIVAVVNNRVYYEDI